MCVLTFFAVLGTRTGSKVRSSKVDELKGPETQHVNGKSKKKRKKGVNRG